MSEVTPDTPCSPRPRSSASLLVCLLLVLGSAGVVWWVSRGDSAEKLAHKQLAEANRLADSGEAARAARLYRQIAEESPELRKQAGDAFRKLLQGPLDTVPLDGAVEMFRLAFDWPEREDLMQGLLERGLQLIELRGNEQPESALDLYDTIAPLVPTQERERERIGKERSARLETWYTKNPSNFRIALAHADSLGERRVPDVENVIKVLEPFRPQLGTGPGARLLGQAYSVKGQVPEALELLEPYCKETLPRLTESERKWQKAYAAKVRAIDAAVEDGTAKGFDFEAYRAASEDDKRQLKGQYINRRAEADSDLRTLKTELMRHAGAAFASLEVGKCYLARARFKIDPIERAADLKRAEEALLAALSTLRYAPDLRFSLVQVAFWTGRPEEGHKRLREVIDLQGRQPIHLMQGAQLLREVGDFSGARKLVEEAYEKEKNQQARHGLAFQRSQLNEDPADGIAWLRKGDPARAEVKTALAMLLARQAQEQGRDQEAATQYRTAIDILAKAPENAFTLNEGGLAWLALFRVTGDKAALDKGLAMIEKAVAAQPDNSLLVNNATLNLQEAACRDLLIDAVDLVALRAGATVDLLSSFFSDRAGREEQVARLLKHPAMQKARAHAEDLLRLQPGQPFAYQFLSRLYLLDRDEKRLKDLDMKLAGAQLDLGEPIRVLMNAYAGKPDERLVKEQKTFRERWEKRVEEQRRKKGGRTLALALTQLGQGLLREIQLGGEVDASALVKLAEEAHALNDCRATTELLVLALLNQAHQRLMKQEPEYQKMAERACHSLDSGHLIAAVLVRGGPLEKPVATHPNVVRACQLLNQQALAFPDEPAPWLWAMLSKTYPKTAAKLAEGLRKDVAFSLSRSITRRLNPLTLPTALEAYWVSRLEGQEKEGEAKLKYLSKCGVPLPFEIE